MCTMENYSCTSLAGTHACVLQLRYGTHGCCLTQDVHLIYGRGLCLETSNSIFQKHGVGTGGILLLCRARLRLPKVLS